MPDTSSAIDPAADSGDALLLAQGQREADAEQGPHTMACLEVWGDNRAVDSAVAMPGLDVHVLATPYQGQAAGGDVHYLSSCATGRISRILVADVAGHGQRVAELATKLRGLMRQYVNYLDQTAFVSRLNQQFGQVSEMGRFATAIVATYWSPTGFLVASNAGHPRPLLYRAADRSWTILKDKPRPEDQAAGQAPANLPLGIDDVSSYDQFAVKLKPGDRVLFYTDSLPEAAPGNNPARQLGESGLLDLVATIDPADPRRFIHEVVDRVTAWAGNPPGDDVTLMLLCPNERPGQASLSARLGAVVSFFSTLAGSWRKNAAPVPWPELSAVNLLGPIFPWLNKRHGG